MKTIVYMGCDFPSGNAAAIRVASNVFALRDLGFNVIVLSYDHVLSERAIEKYSENITVMHVQYPLGSGSHLKYLLSIQEYMKVLETVNPMNVSAIISYDQPAISFIRLKRYCAKRGIALICDCAEWHTAVHLKGIARLVKSLDICLTMRYAYKKADGIIAISEYLKRYYERKVKVICIPPLQFQTREKEIRFISRPRKFVYAGIAGKDKDRLDLIIDAFESVIGDFSIHIFGMEEKDFVQQYDGMCEKISRIREQSKIIFNGYVSHDIILHELEDADFTLLIRNPSRKNNAGFPTKFVECVNYGVPVIANEFSDVKYYIEHYGMGLICEKIGELTKTLQDAVDMSEERLLQLKKNCINYRGFYYESYEKELGEFISSLSEK